MVFLVWLFYHSASRTYWLYKKTKVQLIWKVLRKTWRAPGKPMPQSCLSVEGMAWIWWPGARAFTLFSLFPHL